MVQEFPRDEGNLCRIFILSRQTSSSLAFFEVTATWLSHLYENCIRLLEEMQNTCGYKIVKCTSNIFFGLRKCSRISGKVPTAAHHIENSVSD